MTFPLRYIAQLRLPGWEQERLSGSSALLIGVGGLGLPAALYLAAAGIGRLLLADPDVVAEENFHRQPLYTPEDLGTLKVERLATHLRKLRPDLSIETYPTWIDEANLPQIGREADIWIDGTDNLHSRLVIDAIAFTLQKPWVYGAVYQWEGQAAIFQGVRYRDFFGEAEGGPSCSEGGVLGAVPGLIGSLQAALATIFLSTPAAAPFNRLFRIDLRKGEMDTFAFGPSTLSLELSLEQASQLPEVTWIDLRDTLEPSLPFPTRRLPWYAWENWELPPTPVVLLCEAGNRSRQIAFALRKRTGRRDIYSLRGGASVVFRPNMG
ncbi:MAG: HesA/MoeB/ThiF family protein [Bacteroidia bacterium]|nr:HesA/MoeB/ThiF family protein [Bacteroidia bacterium]